MTTIINNANKKYAVLVAINYTGYEGELNGCINDANHLKTFLMERCGYLPENILMLADDNINEKPTKQNILNSFDTLVSKATNEQYNELWFSYSGHGSYITDLNGDENDKCDEVLCPLDYSTAGMIDDDCIYTNLVVKLPSSATLFMLSDSCHSGTVFDLPYLYTTSLINNNNKNTHVANIMSISGCRDDQTSADAYIAGRYEGAMTWSFLNTLSNTGYNVKLRDLVEKMRTLLLNNYTQIPQLALSISTDLDRYFMQPNTNGTLVTPVTKTINFDIKVDYWYKESTWNVWSVNENKYVFATDNIFTYKYQSMNVSKVLPVGTYKLCIKDSYGDGGVTSKVTCGLVTLVYGNMVSGRLAEYTFTF